MRNEGGHDSEEKSEYRTAAVRLGLSLHIAAHSFSSRVKLNPSFHVKATSTGHTVVAERRAVWIDA